MASPNDSSSDEDFGPVRQIIWDLQGATRLAMFVSRLEGDPKGIVQLYNYGIKWLVEKGKAVQDPSTLDVDAAVPFIRLGTDALVKLVKERLPSNTDEGAQIPTEDEVRDGLLRGMYGPYSEHFFRNKDFWRLEGFEIAKLWTDPATAPQFVGTSPPVFRIVTRMECPTLDLYINPEHWPFPRKNWHIQLTEQPTLRALTEGKYEFSLGDWHGCVVDSPAIQGPTMRLVEDDEDGTSPRGGSDNSRPSSSGTSSDERSKASSDGVLIF
ncbi:hypothetical protein MMC18_009426 [Xylographa bjoerkii]|nr:hypothetical protein [Xylographa bjoerkii]